MNSPVSRAMLIRLIVGCLRGATEKILDQYCCTIRYLRLAFPDHQDAPAVVLKLLPSESVPLNVTGQLRQPVGNVCGRLLGTQTAAMLMPEASVHEYDLPQPGKYKIWSSREVTLVEAETISKSVGYSPHSQLGLCVYLTNAPHVGTTFLRREPISHPTHQTVFENPRAVATVPISNSYAS